MASVACASFPGSSSPAGHLLLDEPTNHLDLDAKNWLLSSSAPIASPPVISHDLELLDEAITRVLTSTARRGRHRPHRGVHGGTYSQYLTARAADEVRLAKKAAKAKEINRLQSVVDRFGAKASKAAMHTASRSASGGSRTSGSTHRSTPRR